MKFHKKYIKALKEGKLAMIDADKYPEIARKILAPLLPYPISDNEFTMKYYYIEDNSLVGNNYANSTPIKSAKDFIKPSIETLTENDVVWCTTKEQCDKATGTSWGRLYKVTIKPDINSAIRSWPNRNIIPYRDLFPKKKKLSERNIKAHLNELTDVCANLKYRLDEISPETKFKDYTLVRGIEELRPALEKRLNKPKTDAIDWGKRQFFYSENGVFILSDGDFTVDCFSGVIAQSNNNTDIGEYGDDWDKRLFKPVDITIKIND